MIDTIKRASAGRVTAVIPYFGYGRTDKKDQPRVPITARLVAKLVGVSGADRALLLDLHAGQIQGFFDVPVDEMSAMSLTASYFAQKRLPDPVVVSPDLGNTKRARNFAEIVDAPLAIIEKRRAGNQDRTEVLNLIGSVEGKQAIIVDDEIDTAGSITQAADVCLEAGATEVYASAIHPVLSGPAVQRLQDMRNQGSGRHQQHRRPSGKALPQAHDPLRGIAAWRDRAADSHRRQRLGDVSHPGRAGGHLIGLPLRAHSSDVSSSGAGSLPSVDEPLEAVERDFRRTPIHQTATICRAAASMRSSAFARFSSELA